MQFLELLTDVNTHYSVSNLLLPIRIETSEDGIITACAHEANKSVIIITKYKNTVDDTEMPHLQGIAQLNYIAKILDLAKSATSTAVEFVTTASGIPTQTIFVLDNVEIKSKNATENMMSNMPKNLDKFAGEFEFDLSKDEIDRLRKVFNLPIPNGNIVLSKTKKGALSIKLTNGINTATVEYDDVVVPEGSLENEFPLEFGTFISIIDVCKENGTNFSVSEKLKLFRISKQNDMGEYTYFMTKRAVYDATE